MPELLDMLIDRISGSLCSPLHLYSVLRASVVPMDYQTLFLELKMGFFTTTPCFTSVCSEHLAVSPPYAKTLSFLGFFFLSERTELYFVAPLGSVLYTACLQCDIGKVSFPFPRFR